MANDMARADASFVLDWLRQTGAPENIVGLQERAVAALGGYVGPERRIPALVPVLVPAVEFRR